VDVEVSGQPIIPTADLTSVMEAFGNYAAKTVQIQANAFENGWISGFVMMSLGMRETNLQNICGGVTKNAQGEWVQAFTDRGIFQVTDTNPSGAKWLASVPGCPNGPDDRPNFKPDVKGFRAGKTSALTAMHSPTFSAGLQYTLKEFSQNRTDAVPDVKTDDLLRFCIAAHNAGFTGAMDGYRAGDVDANTAHGDYSAWVLEQAPQIQEWVSTRPKWQVAKNA
jgi:hypothetical protein